MTTIHVEIPSYLLDLIKEMYLDKFNLYGVFRERASDFIGQDLEFMYYNLDENSTESDADLLDAVSDKEWPAKGQTALEAAILGLVSSRTSDPEDGYNIHPKAKEIWDLYSYFMPGESPLAEYVVKMAEHGISHEDVTDAVDGDKEQMTAICSAIGCTREDILGSAEPLGTEFDRLDSLAPDFACDHDHADIDLLSAFEERLAAAESLAEQVAKNTEEIKILKSLVKSLKT